MNIDNGGGIVVCYKTSIQDILESMFTHDMILAKRLLLIKISIRGGFFLFGGEMDKKTVIVIYEF